MQFATVLAIVAIAVGSVAADTVNPVDCVNLQDVEFCNTNSSAPVFVLGPDGCVTIDGVEFCNCSPWQVTSLLHRFSCIVNFFNSTDDLTTICCDF